MNYYQKYLKYKTKYLELKGGKPKGPNPNKPVIKATERLCPVCQVTVKEYNDVVDTATGWMVDALSCYPEILKGRQNIKDYLKKNNLQIIPKEIHKENMVEKLGNMFHKLTGGEKPTGPNPNKPVTNKATERLCPVCQVTVKEYNDVVDTADDWMVDAISCYPEILESRQDIKDYLNKNNLKIVPREIHKQNILSKLGHMFL